MSKPPCASHAFKSVTTRILWLDAKACARECSGLNADHYRDEISALLWFMDKVVSQASRIVELASLCNVPEHKMQSPRAVLHQEPNVEQLRQKVIR